MKILQAPNNIANQGWAIAEGLRALGHEVEVWHYGPNRFGFPVDRAIEFPPERPADIWRLVDEAIGRFDVFHFHYGRSLVPRQVGALPGLWDLPLYRAAEKPVCFTFHGSDARLKSRHLELDPWSYFRFADVECDEDDILKRIEIIRTFANTLFVSSAIDLPFVPDAAFYPRAISLADWPYVGPSGARPRVVHMPSNRNTKGTSFVLQAVETLKERGLDFEFRLIEDLPAAEVRQAMREMDVLIDNMLLGDYGVAGIEAMALGKTVVTRLDPIVTETMGEVPVLAADPDTLAGVLDRAIRDDRARKDLGESARAFVEREHEATAVARRLVEHYQKPPSFLATAWPDWAALGGARREERLEEVIVELRTRLRETNLRAARGPRLGRFARLGARLDAAARRLRRARTG